MHERWLIISRADACKNLYLVNCYALVDAVGAQPAPRKLHPGSVEGAQLMKRSGAALVTASAEPAPQNECTSARAAPSGMTPHDRRSLCANARPQPWTHSRRSGRSTPPSPSANLGPASLCSWKPNRSGAEAEPSARVRPESSPRFLHGPTARRSPSPPRRQEGSSPKCRAPNR